MNSSIPVKNKSRSHYCGLNLRKGSSLIAVFWIMGVLTLAVFAAVRVVYFDADIAASQLNGSDALLAAERGIAVASNDQVKNGDPLLEWEDRDQDIGYRARYVSEGARFNINYILLNGDKALLTDLFTDWGIELADAQMLIDNLTDWVDSGDLAELNGVERDWYEAQGRVNHPFNRPFYDIDEMDLVKDIELLNAAFPRWKDWFTIWSSGPLDVTEARADLIAAAAEVSVGDAQDVVDFILGPDRERYTEDDAEVQSIDEVFSLLGVGADQASIVGDRMTTNDGVTRIISDGRSGTVKRRITLIVQSREENLNILEKKEEILP